MYIIGVWSGVSAVGARRDNFRDCQSLSALMRVRLVFRASYALGRAAPLTSSIALQRKLKGVAADVGDHHFESPGKR
eukprot:1061856-Pleurochrysis_carterae.AAC.1